jgi:transcriptional regulator with XRE-family HTH domain
VSKLGDYVRARREELGLSQTDVERRFAVPQSYLSRLERGRVAFPSGEYRSRLESALQVTNVDLLLAAGEVSRDELVDWTRVAGIEPTGDGDGRATRLAKELDREDEYSPRWQLANQIPRMTRQEADFLLVAFKHLPTEAGRKRRDTEGRPEEYRRWRDRQDAVEVL